MQQILQVEPDFCEQAGPVSCTRRWPATRRLVRRSSILVIGYWATAISKFTKKKYPESRTSEYNSNRYQYLVDTFLSIFIIKPILGGRNWIQSTYRGRRLPGPKKSYVYCTYGRRKIVDIATTKRGSFYIPQERKKYQKSIIHWTLKIVTSEGSVLIFFDACSNLGHLFLYDFKDLHDHFPEILIAKFKRFIYCIGLFDIIYKNSVKFPPSWAYLYGNNIYYKNWLWRYP